MEKHYVTAIILAAGVGRRMESDITKQRMTLLGKSVLERTLDAFDAASLIDDVIVVTREDELDFANCEIKKSKKAKRIIIGGKTRAESAKLGFSLVEKSCEYVAIHDAARCLVEPSDIDSVISDAIIYGAATASMKLSDSIKEISENRIKKSLDRDKMRLMQTPQVFKRELYERALASADMLDASLTDDNMLMERISFPVYCTETSATNIKITTKTDFEYAEFLLSKRNI